MKFRKLLETQKRVFIPFFVLGFPTPEKCLTLIEAALDGGCEAIELGIPFKDATADGLTIQEANAVALQNKADFECCINLIKAIRKKSQCALSLLVYANLIYPNDFSRLKILKDAGIDAILTVDIPPHENERYENALKNSGLETCHLIAPNTNHKRIQNIMDQIDGYAYIVSDYGTTGVRGTLPTALKARIQEIKNMSKKPLVVGFGVHTAAQVKEIFDHGAEGVIVGSALIRLIQQDLMQAEQNVFEYVKTLS